MRFLSLSVFFVIALFALSIIGLDAAFQRNYDGRLLDACKSGNEVEARAAVAGGASIGACLSTTALVVM